MATKRDTRTRTDARPATAPPRQGGGAVLLGQHQTAAVDSLHRLLLEPLSSLLTCAVIGIAILLLQNLQGLDAGIDRTGSISLFMTEKNPAKLHELVATLQRREDIRSVTLITPDQALQEFEAKSGFAEALAGLDENPLPPVLTVLPAIDDTAGVTALFDYLQALPGVDVAQLDLQWLQRLNAAINVAARLASLLALLLGVGVVLVIGNTIRLAISNRSAEIVVVKLVGGTDAYVARPFLYTGLWYGIGGGVIAVVLTSLGLWALSGSLAQLLATYDSDFTLTGPGLQGSFAVLAVAGVLGWLGALVSVLRHLRAIEPR
ncbi:MAG: permease-like cell division protein FtsX [Pseudomonadota bacterium]